MTKTTNPTRQTTAAPPITASETLAGEGADTTDLDALKAAATEADARAAAEEAEAEAAAEAATEALVKANAEAIEAAEAKAAAKVATKVAADAEADVKMQRQVAAKAAADAKAATKAAARTEADRAERLDWLNNLLVKVEVGNTDTGDDRDDLVTDLADHHDARLDDEIFSLADITVVRAATLDRTLADWAMQARIQIMALA